jgi:hypothetical protein
MSNQYFKPILQQTNNTSTNNASTNQKIKPILQQNNTSTIAPVVTKKCFTLGCSIRDTGAKGTTQLGYNKPIHQLSTCQTSTSNQYFNRQVNTSNQYVNEQYFKLILQQTKTSPIAPVVTKECVTLGYSIQTLKAHQNWDMTNQYINYQNVKPVLQTNTSTNQNVNHRTCGHQKVLHSRV